MDQVVVCAEQIDPGIVQSALPAAEVTSASTRRQLVEALVGAARLVGAIVEPTEDDWPAFLASVRESFALLPIVVLAADGCPSGTECLDPGLAPQELGRRIAAYFGGQRPTDRRRHLRYDWPLRATIDEGLRVHRIREISAGGAFLEPIAPVPEPRSRCTIRVEFQNFRMTTQCEILDPRHVSSRAEPGFGVRFIDLSEKARAFIDRIVNDAVAQVLLDPDADPGVPSIEEEEDVLSVGDEFSLSL